MTSYTAIFLFLFNKGQTHKTKGEGQKALHRRRWDTVPLSTNRLLYHIILSIHCPLLLVDGFFNKQNVEIFCNCRVIVTREGTQWAIEQLGVHVMFPSNAVSEPTPIIVQRWKNSVRSPPLQEHEAITSNVIELSAMARQGLKFNTKVKLSLSHSATDLRGYELVIKKLIDKETNIWEEVDGTIDIRCREGIGSPFIE